MHTLTGKYRGSNENVNFDDSELKRKAIKILKETHGFDLEINKNKYGIDLLHKNRKGGVELEAGKWLGHYLEQDYENFNKFTLDFTSFNTPERKNKYFRILSDLISKYGKPYTHHEPDYLYNSFARFNRDFTQFWYIDAERFTKEGALVVGAWKTSTVSTGDIEIWSCFRREDVDIYNLIDGIWVKENLIEIQNDATYKSYMDGYTREFHARKNSKS